MTTRKYQGQAPADSRETLRLAYLLDQRISSKLRQAEDLNILEGQARRLLRQRSAPAPTTHLPPESQPGLGEPANRENTLTKLTLLKQEIEEDIKELIDLKGEIKELIHSLPDPKQQLLLELKYLSYLTWQDVADTMNYSYRQIQRLHRQAIRKLDKSLRPG